MTEVPEVPDQTINVTRYCVVCGKRVSRLQPRKVNRCMGCISKKWFSKDDWPFNPNPCPRCGNIFKAPSKNVKYCENCPHPAALADKKRRERNKLAKQVFEAEAAAAAEEQLQKESEKPATQEALARMEQRAAAKRSALIQKYGEAAVKQYEYEDSVYFMFYDALAYVKGEPQTFIQDDSDFADAEARLEELLAKYRYKQRQRWAIKLALETNPANRLWMQQNLLSPELWETIPHLPPPKWFQSWRYVWENKIEEQRSKELNSSKWELLIQRPTIDEDFKLLREYMTS